MSYLSGIGRFRLPAGRKPGLLLVTPAVFAAGSVSSLLFWSAATPPPAVSQNSHLVRVGHARPLRRRPLSPACDPGIDLPFEHIERQRTLVQHRVMKSPQIELSS